LYWC
jgi:hypothetical protein